MEKIALVNVGSNEDNIGRSPIFEDGTFVYLPIPEIFDEENYDVSFRFPKYSDLGLEEFSEVDGYVHYDPNFEDKTYGHVNRGFGYETILSSLTEGDILCFYATLSFKGHSEKKLDWIHPKWGTYIIGLFEIKGVYTKEEFINLPYEERFQFIFNPHFLRKEHGANLWIAGKKDKFGLLDKAFPLHNSENNQIGNDFVKNNFKTSGGKQAGNKNYYRHAMICHDNLDKALDQILET
ncbi:MAG: hypothetical protein HeimC3_52420 [Candidatus Heimdallarchaeota archaeon LC_3]|nr:MAG: hypothetical protein HeimC3_52420 [Candidatus Heimdallarchaeota archaeon LC_3]